MESLRLIVTETALEDLRSLHEYLAEQKNAPVTADRFTKDLTNKLYHLAAKGMTGSPRDHVSEGLRGYPYRGWCFYLRVVDDKLYVVRVLNSKQDISSQEFPKV